MPKIKFIQIIFILFILTFGLSVSAEKRNIELYFFYSPLCSACSQAETSLGALKTKYPHLQIKRFEIFEKNNQRIYSALTEIYQTSSNSIPGIFIEEKGFNNCSSTTISEIEKILIRCSRQECNSPTQKLLTNSAEKKIPSSKFNLNIIYIVASVSILGFILIKIFFRKRKEPSNDPRQ